MRCIFVNITLKCKRPLNPAYPHGLITLGDHLRAARLDRGFSQLQVAKILNVTADTVTGWELNRHIPSMRLAKSIAEFLGYLPFKTEDLSIGKKLYLARLISGKTQEQIAVELGCDESNLRFIELGVRNPGVKTFRKIENYYDSVLSGF